jgi:hypothetical protein
VGLGLMIAQPSGPYVDGQGLGPSPFATWSAPLRTPPWRERRHWPPNQFVNHTEAQLLRFLYGDNVFGLPEHYPKSLGYKTLRAIEPDEEIGNHARCQRSTYPIQRGLKIAMAIRR